MEAMKKYMESLHAAFVGDDVYEILGYFSLPVVVYSVAGVTVLRSEDELLRSAEDYRNAFQPNFLSSIKVSIVQKDAAMNRRFRVTVRYRGFVEGRDFVAGTLVRYFLVEQDGAFKIEMLEYIEDPIPREDSVHVVH